MTADSSVYNRVSLIAHLGTAVPRKFPGRSAFRPRYRRELVIRRNRPGGFLERFRRTRAHQWIAALEPWGILAAVLALIVAITQFWFEHADRVKEREVRAWQLVTTTASGNSGKIAALEYLNKEDGLLCFDRLQGRLTWLHGEENAPSGCVVPLKRRTPLVGIDLSVPDSSDSNTPVAPFNGVFLQDIDLSKALLASANLTGAILTDADLTDAVLARADLTGAFLIDADLPRAVLKDADLTGARLVDADLTGAVLADADLTDAVLADADLADAVLARANLTRANLAGAILQRVVLAGADLAGADLTDAILRNADLRGANLSGTDLIGANLMGADLRYTAVTQPQLDSAYGNEATLLPVGLTVPIRSD